MATRDEILAELSAMRGPDGGSLVERIRSLVVTDGRVGLALAAGGDDRATMETLRREVEARVAALAGVAAVLAAVVEDDTAPQPAGLGARARRLAGRLVGGRDAEPARPAAGDATIASPVAPSVSPSSRAGGGQSPAARPAGGAGAPQPPAAHPGGGAPHTPAARRPSGAPGTPAAQPPQPPRPAGAPPGVAKIVAVGSGKGGVGKSTVAVNLAVAFAAMGFRVGLVDADIFGPSVPILLGQPSYRPTGGRLAPVAAHGIVAMSVGFLVDPDKAVVWRGPMVTGALMQLVRDTTWGELDVLFIDMPPGTGDVQLSLAQQLPLDGAVVVTTPQDLALADVRKAIQMFETVKVPLLGIVENMATFVCPCCGTETAIFGEGGGEREAFSRDAAFLGRLPLALAIREASDAGTPPATDPSTPAGAAYAAIAANLAGVLDRTVARPFPEIVFEG